MARKTLDHIQDRQEADHPLQPDPDHSQLAPGQDHGQAQKQQGHDQIQQQPGHDQTPSILKGHVLCRDLVLGQDRNPDQNPDRDQGLWIVRGQEYPELPGPVLSLGAGPDQIVVI